MANLRLALGWTVVQAGTRIGIGIFTAKLSAIYLGPAGIGLVGQLNTFVSLAQGLVANGANTAVVNLTSASSTDKNTMHRVWSAAMGLVLTATAAIAVVSTIFSNHISYALFADRRYWPAVIVGALAAVLVAVDGVLLAALNGLKQVSLIAKAGLLSGVLEALTFATLVYLFGVTGGLIGVLALYSVKLSITHLSATAWSNRLPILAFKPSLDPVLVKRILGFFPMLIAHSIAIPLSQLIVRRTAIGELGLEQAGFLQATWRLSDVYVGVITTALGMFFIAEYSSLAERNDRIKLVKSTVLQVGGLASLAAALIFALRDLIIPILLTNHFGPVKDLLPLQLWGDVFKLIAYPVQMALVAERQTALYISVAVAGPLLFAVGNSLLISRMGTMAAPLAYASSYFLMLPVLAIGVARVQRSIAG
jgi:O-antigen/teichoic acid export membrane protein